VGDSHGGALKVSKFAAKNIEICICLPVCRRHYESCLEQHDFILLGNPFAHLDGESKPRLRSHDFKYARRLACVAYFAEVLLEQTDVQVQVLGDLGGIVACVKLTKLNSLAGQA
jgi:hypothetical protein